MFEAPGHEVDLLHLLPHVLILLCLVSTVFEIRSTSVSYII